MMRMPSLAHMRPNCVSGARPASFSASVAGPHIDILPVRVQSLRNAVLLDPASEQVGRRPSRFLLPQVAQDGAGGVVHQIHQTSFWTASLEPSMKTSIQLHQLAAMCLALAPLAIRSALALPTP